VAICTRGLRSSLWRDEKLDPLRPSPMTKARRATASSKKRCLEALPQSNSPILQSHISGDDSTDKTWYSTCVPNSEGISTQNSLGPGDNRDEKAGSESEERECVLVPQGWHVDSVIASLTWHSFPKRLVIP
jgi:hypothetical protein